MYNEVMELHDPLRLLVEVDGHYRALLHEKTLEEGTVQSPIDSSSLPILEKFDNVHLEIRPGVKDYSFFRASIGFDIERALRMSWPPDTARDCDCSIWYTKRLIQKSQLCEKCTSLKKAVVTQEGARLLHFCT